MSRLNKRRAILWGGLAVYIALLVAFMLLDWPTGFLLWMFAPFICLAVACLVFAVADIDAELRAD